MKFGIRLLLLVALLLPLRGTLAVAGTLCHLGLAETVAMQAADAGHAHPAADRAGHGVDHVHHGHDRAPAAPDPAEHGAAASGALPSCTFCSSVCAAPPLPAAGMVVHELLPSGAERFPALPPPVAAGAFGAPERPPRSA